MAPGDFDPRRSRAKSDRGRLAETKAMSVLYFLLLIGVLVLFHELGHFTAAKLLDFEVTRFSLGFGRPLIRVVAGETEYQLGVFPLGGYVRIAGEDPEERGGERSGRSFDAKPLWQRLIVVFAGPAANLLLPLIIYFALFVGETHLPAAVIGDIIGESPAELAGLRSGDRITSIDGESIRYWEDVERIVGKSPGREIRIGVERGNKSFERYIEPVAAMRRRVDGRTGQVGVIGITRAPFLPEVGIADTQSAAAMAGLRTGDIVIAIEGKQIESERKLRRSLERLATRAGSLAHLSYLRGVPVLPGISILGAHSTQLRAEPGNQNTGRVPPTALFGIVSADVIVGGVDAGSPADQAGLAAGDAIISIDGHTVTHWLELTRILDEAGTNPVALKWTQANGGVREASLAMRPELVRDAFGNQTSTLIFGAHTRYALGPGSSVAIADRFRYAAGKAMERTGETISVVGAAFWSILRGKSPREELGGPITMYRAAAVSGERGWMSFFLIIALISISVALINILPIPVLDGGHVLVFLIEGIRGKPLTRTGHNRFAIAGYTIVGIFTVLALGNDLVRFFFP